jgi:prepilin-type N-terminal cleavage/methylation domain-containing protein
MTKRNIHLGFNLTEILIAIAIIGVLSAVAVPSYSAYTIKSKTSDAISLFGTYKRELALSLGQSENDQFGQVVSGLTDGSLTTHASNQVYNIRYNRYPAAGPYTKALITIWTEDLGITGYVKATDGTGVSIRIVFGVKLDASENIETYCGQYDGSVEDIPITFLTSTCSDLNIKTTLGIP